MSNYPYAKYSETFMEFMDNNDDFLDNLIDLDSSVHTEKLKAMIKEYYSFYEIGAETEDLFKLYFTSVYNINRDYYVEKLVAYEKEFDYTKGITRTQETTTERNDTNLSTTNDTDYDLPNKALSVSSNYKQYPSNIGDTSVDSKDTSKGTASTTFTDNRDFLAQKERYMRQIRNIYLEFVLKFRECFVPIYN